MKYLILFASMALIVSCTSRQKPQVIAVADSSARITTPPDSVDYIKAGVDLMFKEDFGGLKAGMYAEEVITILGEADVKSDTTIAGEFNLVWQTWYYLSTGCQLQLYRNPDQTWQLDNYSLNNNTLLKSTRGIGIGSTSEEVKKAYHHELSPLQVEGQIVAGTTTAGIVFFMANGRVVSITVGTPEEPEYD